MSEPAQPEAAQPETTQPTASISRRRALGILGASALGAFGPRTVHPLVPMQEGEAWRPRFFDDDQLERVAALADVIVPETDTPGARGALVHQYIDWVVAEDDAEAQGRFSAGLDWIERESRARFGSGLLGLGAEQRHELLAELAELAERPAPPGPPGLLGAGDDDDQLAIAFFRDLKARTIHGYYRSEVGMVQEMDYEGNLYLRRFEGCRHPEHQAWEPAARPADAEPRSGA